MQQDASASFIFEKYLFDLAKRSLITAETARDYASDRSIFDQMKLGTYVIPLGRIDGASLRMNRPAIGTLEPLNRRTVQSLRKRAMNPPRPRA